MRPNNGLFMSKETDASPLGRHLTLRWRDPEQVLHLYPAAKPLRALLLIVCSFFIFLGRDGADGKAVVEGTGGVDANGLDTPVGPREALLLVASRNQIVSDDITAQPNVVRSLVRDGRNIVALDFDSATDRVYWSDTTQDRIWSMHKNGSDRTVVSWRRVSAWA